MACELRLDVEQPATSPVFDDFLQTGRTGRRNAVPDIRAAANVSTAQLPDALQKLTCSESPNGTVCSAGPSTSSAQSVAGSMPSSQT